ncbi:MAG: F-box protein, partial [Parachlamydiales bacterium]|nr:F-box protein [Parachlamydiales bacterium]
MNFGPIQNSNFPLDAFRHILSSLSPKDLFQAAQVNKLWNKITDEKEVWDKALRNTHLNHTCLVNMQIYPKKALLNDLIVSRHWDKLIFKTSISDQFEETINCLTLFNNHIILSKVMDSDNFHVYDMSFVKVKTIECHSSIGAVCEYNGFLFSSHEDTVLLKWNEEFKNEEVSFKTSLNRAIFQFIKDKDKLYCIVKPRDIFEIDCSYNTKYIGMSMDNIKCFLPFGNSFMILCGNLLIQYPLNLQTRKVVHTQVNYITKFDEKLALIMQTYRGHKISILDKDLNTLCNFEKQYNRSWETTNFAMYDRHIFLTEKLPHNEYYSINIYELTTDDKSYKIVKKTQSDYSQHLSNI